MFLHLVFIVIKTASSLVQPCFRAIQECKWLRIRRIQPDDIPFVRRVTRLGREIAINIQNHHLNRESYTSLLPRYMTFFTQRKISLVTLSGKRSIQSGILMKGIHRPTFPLPILPIPRGHSFSFFFFRPKTSMREETKRETQLFSLL